MRHIVVYDTEITSWIVIDTQAARMVVGIYDTRQQAEQAADAEEFDWPPRGLDSAA